LKVVIDTNIFLSGLLNLEGGAAKIIDHFQNGRFDLVVSREVFEEYVRVIHEFDNAVPSAKSEELLEFIFEKAEKVKASDPDPKGLCKDSDDEKFLTAAISGKAQFIVTKNKKDFPRDLKSLRIVNVREFLNELER
jgi:putative PIN family toxin of toxin-antitoxin system